MDAITRKAMGIMFQLDLPLNCVYQLTIAGLMKMKAVRKNIPNIPKMIQLDIEFSKPQKISIANKVKYAAIGIAVAIAGLGIATAIAG